MVLRYGKDKMRTTMHTCIVISLSCIMSAFIVGCEDGGGGSDPDPTIHVFRYDPASNTVIPMDIVYPDQLTANDYLSLSQANTRIVQPTPPEPTDDDNNGEDGGGGNSGGGGDSGGGGGDESPF